MIDLSLNGRWQHMIDTTNNQTRIRMAAAALAAAGLIGESDARLILDQVVAARRDGVVTNDIMRLLTYRPKGTR